MGRSRGDPLHVPKHVTRFGSIEEDVTVKRIYFRNAKKLVKSK